MTPPFVVARHASAEAISVGLVRMGIAAHLSGARNDKRQRARNDTPPAVARHDSAEAILAEFPTYNWINFF